MPINTQSIAYRDGETELTGLLVSNDSRYEKRPGILVVHGGAGLDDHAKERARRIAELGFVVFACDMYGNGVAGNRERVIARIMELRKDPRRLCERARAGVEVLASHPRVDRRFAAVGYGCGGMTVLELARSGMNLAGVISLHGSLETKYRKEVLWSPSRFALSCGGGRTRHCRSILGGTVYPRPEGRGFTAPQDEVIWSRIP